METSISNVKTQRLIADVAGMTSKLLTWPAWYISDVCSDLGRAGPFHCRKSVRAFFIFYLHCLPSGSAGKTSYKPASFRYPMVHCRLSNKWSRTTYSSTADSVLMMSKAFLTMSHGKASWDNSLQQVFRGKGKTTNRSTRLKHLRPFEWQRWEKIGLRARRWSFGRAHSEIQLWSGWSTIDRGDCILT